jgi:hypothetical protein
VNRQQKNRRQHQQQQVAAGEDHRPVDDEDADDDPTGINDADTLFNRSAKAAFSTKILSSVADYSARYDLLQFQHDSFVYHVVSATKSVSKRFKIGQANALADRTWVSKYWEWHHAGLVDLVRQFGTPDACYTMAPYEFLWHWPQWLQDLKQKLNRSDMELPALETLHLVHSLRQIVVGFMAGGNGSKPTVWREHVFADKSQPTRNSILCMWYRLEFQEGSKAQHYHGRGSPHIHVLWWFKDMRTLGLERTLRGNVDVEEDPRIAALASVVQRSDQPSKAERLEPTEITWSESGQRFVVMAQYTAGMLHQAVRHGQNTVRKALRLFMVPLMRAAPCHQDWTSITPDSVNAALMKYMASYVSKMKAPMDKILKAADTEWEAAHRVVSEYCPMEPQMIVDLASVPLFWTTATTKRFRLPNPEDKEPWALEHYRLRDLWGSVPVWQNGTLDEVPYARLSLLQWLRTHTEDKATGLPKRCQKSLMAVEAVMAPVQSDHFYGQWLMLRVPHQCLQELTHPQHDVIPKKYQWIAAAGHHRPDVWRDELTIRALFELMGHRHDYSLELASTVLSDLHFIDMLLDGSVPSFDTGHLPQTDNVLVRDFTTSQRQVYHRMVAQLERRRVCRFDDEIDEEAWIEELSDEKGTFVSGGPGTGKSTVAIAVARMAMEKGLQVRMSFPAARLQNEFVTRLPHATMGTVHSHFGIGHAAGEEATWKIKQAPQEDDLWVIDELSRLPENIVDHILKTRAAARNWPVILFLGDFSQVGAIGKGCALTSVAFNQRIAMRPLQPASNRSKDVALLEFLAAIRSLTPEPWRLQAVIDERLLAQNFDEAVVHKFFEPGIGSQPTVLTVTNKGAHEVNAKV